MNSMKSFKLLKTATFVIIAVILFSSCGIMNNRDFSSRKYTHFKKGESTVNVKRVPLKEKEVKLYAIVTEKKEIKGNNFNIIEQSSKVITTPKPEIKNETSKKEGHFNIRIAENKKAKIIKTASSLKDKISNKPNTLSTNDDALSILWVLVLVLLLLWAVGYWGFGLSGLLNILLVIALILLILWLLRII